MSSDARLTVGLALAAALGWAACADLSRGEPPFDGGAPDDAATTEDGAAALSFATDVYPLLTAGCAACHAAGGAAAGTQLALTGKAATDAPAVQKLVDTAAPASSRLLIKATGNASHGGGTVYAAGSPEYETLLHWIQQGARP
jgi:mono/diheme cytochrome c family protein